MSNLVNPDRVPKPAKQTPTPPPPPSGYISPFQRVGHEGPCSSMRFPQHKSPKPDKKSPTSRQTTEAIDLLVAAFCEHSALGHAARTVMLWMDWSAYSAELDGEEIASLEAKITHLQGLLAGSTTSPKPAPNPGPSDLMDP